MSKQKKANSSKKAGFGRTQKGVYMSDKVWKEVGIRAIKEERSQNFVIEKALISQFGIE